MRVVEVREEAELPGWKSAWNDLLSRSASDTVFLTWEWTHAWWSAYGGHGDLRILAAFDTHDRLVGIAPLRRRLIRRYGVLYEALSFLCDGSNDSDYLDFITLYGHERQVMEAFCGHLAPDLSAGIVLELNEIPESSPNVPFLRALGAQKGMAWREVDVPCATVPMAEGWEAYLRLLAPRFRTKLRSTLRNVEARPEARFEACRNCEDLDHWLSELFELHGRRWARASKPGVFRSESKRRFYQEVSPLLLDRGWLFFSTLKWKEQSLACQYGLVYGNRYFQLQEGFDPDCEHWQTGIALRAWSIRELLQQGVAEYDFLGGIGRHKLDWGAKRKVSKRLVLCRATVENTLLCRGPEWGERARSLIAGRLPERLLEARSERLERKRVENFRRNSGGVPTRKDGGWVRSALAAVYAHSPLPSLLPRLRDRYRLGSAGDDGRRAIHFERRLRPSVRILYFHRISDDTDPFLGSMPTEQFAEQMRFVARHYQVVSLPEAVRRLWEGCPPVPVVAITFDDGYQDNYLNAFPILQKYGLTATIFLTTGPIDTGERLWFERVGLAVKETSKQYLDLEIDIPRRFWIRDEVERLLAKDRIIALLRRVPETARYQSVERILTELGMPHSGDKAMLTWDQIRSMHRAGIGFGGHTVNHPFLSRVCPEKAVWEISECKRRIEQELQTGVEFFAYPNGRKEDFSDRNKMAVKQAGYRAAVSTIWGVNEPGTDPMELRRGQPWETTPSTFAAKFDWYQWRDL
jgi:peptidoglycan/xylan/chitin deacetylase (PgdA/CDA1 family)/CelD/BcsL family acetyltransferase involved in cellulose biosynthesis